MPSQGETRADFLDRCMSDPEANSSFPDSDQRYAFCNSQWDNRKRMVLDLTDIEDGLADVRKQTETIRSDMSRQANDALKETMAIKESIRKLPHAEIIERINKAIETILGKDYKPVLNVTVDNSEVAKEMKQGNDEIIVLLTEIKDRLGKRATGFTFERDQQGFIKSPIKITYAG